MFEKYGYGFIKKKNISKYILYTTKKENCRKVNFTDLVSLDKLNKCNKKTQGTKVINLKKKITEAQFNLTVNVYNGCKWVPIIITSSKIGRKYKDFILTKRMGSSIHRLKKKKKK